MGFVVPRRIKAHVWLLEMCEGAFSEQSQDTLAHGDKANNERLGNDDLELLALGLLSRGQHLRVVTRAKVIMAAVAEAVLLHGESGDTINLEQASSTPVIWSNT